MRHAMTAALAVAILFGRADAAEVCDKPLMIVTSIGMAPVQDDRAILIPVGLSGVQKLLLVDTGGVVTEMSSEVADELKLPRYRTSYQLYDVSGRVSNEYVKASLQLGRLSTDGMAFMLAPPGQTFFADDTGVAGLLGAEILKNYDVEIDMDAHRLSLLSQDHCEGKVVYWKADTVAVVPMKVMASGHILLPVELDGKEVTALLDTGAYGTTLSQQVAEATFGFRPNQMELTGMLPGRDGAATYHHRFKTLGFEGITVTNPDIDIIPDFMKQVAHEIATPELGSHLSATRSDETAQAMILGMDVLRHFHIYIAYKEDRVYITPAKPASK